MVTNTPAIIDIDLSVTSKKKFRINGDDSRVIELNTSDMNIIQRISEVYPKLKELQQKAASIANDIKSESNDDVEVDNDEITESMESAKIISTRLTEIDSEMRKLIDYLFDAEVSSKAAPDGSMYDPFNGTFRFDHIIVALIGQYENNLNDEYEKLNKQVSKHTNKYTRK